LFHTVQNLLYVVPALSTPWPRRQRDTGSCNFRELAGLNIGQKGEEKRGEEGQSDLSKLKQQINGIS